MGVRLPEEYQEVEYIECDGNEYIDTGYYVKSENVRIIISCFTSSSYYEYDFIGNQDSSTGRFVFGSVNVGFFLYARDRIGNETNLQYQSDYAERYYLFDATYNLEAGIKSLSVNGITASNSHTRSVISTRSVQVFANGSGTNRRPSGKYYHVTLYDAGALAFDLIPCYRKSDNKTGMYDLVSGGFFTSQGTGEFLVGPDVIDSISPWLVAWRRIMMAAASRIIKRIATGVSGVVNFVTKVKKPVKVTCEFSPVQEGTGDPSPDNVRPISGWTGCEIHHASNNILGPKGSDRLYPTFIPKGVTVKASHKSTANNTIRYYRKDKTQVAAYFIQGTADAEGYKSRLYTATEDIYWVKFDSDTKDQQLNFGSTRLPYNEPQAATLPITFTDPSTGDPLIVYGGTVTLNEDGSADLVANSGIYAPPVNNCSINHGTYSSRTQWKLPTPSTSATSSRKHGALCNVALEMNAIWANSNYTSNSGTKDGGFSIATTGTWLSLYDSDTAITAEEFAAKYDGLIVVYPLATPLTYHFANVGQLKAFIGQNNIWHNMNGQITVEYYNYQ